MILQKIIHFFARRAMTEYVDIINGGFFYRRIYNDHIKRYEFAQQHVLGNVLDVACGEGYGTFALSFAAESVIGVDVMSSVVQNAKNTYGKKAKNLTFIHENALRFLSKNPNTFDNIVSFETIEHIKEYVQFCNLAYKALKEGGVFIVSTPNKMFSDYFAGETFNPYHVHEFYTEELVQLLEGIFGNKPILFLQRPIKRDHIFWSFVKVFLFQKESIIIPNRPGITGIDIICIVRKMT